ncbi:MAG: YCF48-related protein [Planctomycetaceae bacterium]|nr:YCF48-related protein [Planctomycetaceae bacterium]
MVFTLLLSLLSALPAAGNAAEGDARLNQICFVDAQHGWAVGDRGVILHTADGGQRWEPQTSGVDCSLFSVCFITEQLGWAAGGQTHPYTHSSTGVLLNTRDGGKTWNRERSLVLPALRKIGFFDARRGWAAGCRSVMYPSGAFLTDDGGHSWRPIIGDTAAGWSAGQLLGHRFGLLTGRGGWTGLVRGGQLDSFRADGAELRSFAAVSLLAPTAGWLVGEGGLLRQLAENRQDGSADTAQPATSLGSTALVVPSGVAAGPFAKTLRHFDFTAVAARGAKCWVAGNPGTLVFCTADAGRSWQSTPTGSPVPLRALAFVDEQHGWAAGDLGTILATEDGGRSWRLQRSGGSRAALLCIITDPEDIPLELVARLSGNEGYRTAIEMLCRRDIELAPRDDVPLADRLHEAVVRLGGSAVEVAWQFPLRQKGVRLGRQQIVDIWDSVNGGHGLDAMRAEVVRAIRTWRPDVLATGDQGRPDDDPLQPLVQQAVLQAVSDAADAGAFADQISEAGLKPWRVGRVFTSVPAEGRGAVELVTAQFAPALGRSLEDAAMEPRGLISDRFEPSPRMLAFRVPATKTGVETNQRDFFGGLSVAPGSESRRALPPPPDERADVLQALARKRRQAQAIVAMAERRGGIAEQLLAQIDRLTNDLAPEGAGQLYYQLADHYYRSGRWPSAAETFEALVQRYPQHSLTPLALRWLVQYYGSEEAAWRVSHDLSQQAKWRERAVAFGQQIERTRFEWFGHPSVRFPLAAAYRGLGQPRQADRLYQGQGRNGGRDAWWATAQAELQSADGKSRAAKPMLTCVKTESRPRLDGKLDDPVWRKAKPIVLRSAQGGDDDWPASVMLAYDAEFLYLAIDCRRPAGAAPPVEAETRSGRPRDADLSAHDRVEILLDIDRDYATYYHLAIDHRGWTFDRCWEDATWDPTWFVASKQDSDRWTAEAAIPLSELTGRPPQPRDRWAIGIQRVVPGFGFQSWSTPAAVAPLPDGFGCLAFE